MTAQISAGLGVFWEQIELLDGPFTRGPYPVQPLVKVHALMSLSLECRA